MLHLFNSNAARASQKDSDNKDFIFANGLKPSAGKIFAGVLLQSLRMAFCQVLSLLAVIKGEKKLMTSEICLLNIVFRPFAGTITGGDMF
ncbi:hypothetical protein AVEN_128769-1 [Araneus ventricosus]|uniref:Uncharacterized protein n=1 Tax=Araneus ventricosus TaxID=182803 RepID=A0A4Y2Q6P0_ARAVE|nr:hypothetical protein AVEN_227943-1 [Araneus ventricosus]GBN59812.1 hypothetical protein AVEN_128769-1 [Araneus ventricosus]